MVFVKTAVYHALGTLMPYPSEDPTHAGWFLPDWRLFYRSATILQRL